MSNQHNIDELQGPNKAEVERRRQAIKEGDREYYRAHRDDKE